MADEQTNTEAVSLQAMEAFMRKYHAWAQSLSPQEQAAGRALMEGQLPEGDADTAGHVYTTGGTVNHGTVGSHSGGWGVVGHPTDALEHTRRATEALVAVVVAR